MRKRFLQRARFARASILVMAFLCFSGLAWAAPRVAIVTPLSGEVLLDGARLRSPRMAEEGQKITVASGGEARLQLLGSGKETVVRGQAEYTISKKKLERDAKTVSRGSVSVVKEIGSINQAAATSARAVQIGEVYKPLGFALTLPPTPVGDVWETRVRTPLDLLDISPGNEVNVVLTDLTDRTRDPLAVVVDVATDNIGFEEGMLSSGHRYEVEVTRPSHPGYLRHFQILTPDEEVALAETARTMRGGAVEGDTIPVLLRLVSLYQSFDQLENVAAVLTEIVESPQSKSLDTEARKELLQTLNLTRNSLDLTDYEPAPKTP